MSKGKEEKYQQFGRLFGRNVHMLESTNVDANHKGKDEAVAIKQPAILHTIKSVKVNTLRQTTLQGGVEAVVINGGEKEIAIGLNEEIIMSAAKYPDTREKKAFFGSYRAANDLCNAANRAEISRLTAIKNDLEGQIGALEAVIEANERAVPNYPED